MSTGSLDWEQAKRHLDSVMSAYTSLIGMPGVMVGPAIMLVLEPLARRYNSGERTRELHDAIMATE